MSAKEEAAAGSSSSMQAGPSIGVPSANVPEETKQQTSWLQSLWAVIGRMRSVALLSAALVSSGVAWLGIVLLAFLFVARNFAPASANIVRPLYFDYTEKDAVATVNLLNLQRSARYTHTFNELNHRSRKDSVPVPHSKERWLPPGEQISLWVELYMPEVQPPQLDVFQAVGELRSADGVPVARSSRPVLPVKRSALSHLVRLFTVAPLEAIGLWHDWYRMRVTLFERYTETRDAPFAVFVCKLHGRAGGGLPPSIGKAEMHIRLHIGVLRRLLYWVRPGTLLTVLLVLGGVAAVLGGGAFASIFFLLWLYSISRPTTSRPEGLPTDEDALSTESSNGVSGDVSPDSGEESPWLEVSPAGGAEADYTEPDLDFSLLSPTEAAAVKFPASRRQRGSDGALAAGGGSPVKERGSELGLSSPFRRR